MIRTRRLVTFLLGAWLGMSLLVAWIATNTVRTSQNVSSQLPHQLEDLRRAVGSTGVDSVVRWQTSRLNRTLFAGWGLTQLALGGVLFFLLLFGTSAGRWTLALAIIMVGLAATQHFIIGPPMNASGQAVALDFEGRLGTERARFQFLHGIYLGLEAAKLSIGVIVTLIFLSSRSGRERSRSKKRGIDFIDHADHSHIDR